MKMNNKNLGVIAICLAVVFVVCGVLGVGILAGSRLGDDRAGNWFSGSAEFTQSFDLPFSEDMALNIEVSHIDVHLIADDTLSGRVVAQFEGSAPRNTSGKRIDAFEDGSSITFKQIHEGFSINVGIAFINDKLTVRVPSGALRGVSITSSSGRIEASGVTATQDFTATASSGAVSLSYITAANITLNATSGRLELDSARASGDIAMKASSGAIRCVSSGADNIRASASSGRVDLSRSQAISVVRAETSSGSISLDNVDALTVESHASSGGTHMEINAPTVRVETTSGSITIGNRAVADADIRASSGDVRYTAPSLDNAALNLSSSSGSIRAGGSRSDKSLTRQGNEGSITVRTSSGSITIN